MQNYLFRVKAYIGQSNKQNNITMLGFGYWEKNLQDGYYYFKNELTNLQEIGVCTSLILPQNLSLKSNVNYSLIFTAELVYNSNLINGFTGIGISLIIIIIGLYMIIGINKVIKRS